jgi:TatA/E family protein of Tat protein translocase
VDILGVGPMELIVILLLLLLVFGPDRLPEIGSKLGKGVRSMRRATRDFSEEIQQARDAIEKPAGEIVAPIQQISQPIQEAAQPFQDVKASALALSQAAKAVRDPGKAIRDSVMQSVKGDKGESGVDELGTTEEEAPGASTGETASSASGDGGRPGIEAGQDPTEPLPAAASDLAG